MKLVQYINLIKVGNNIKIINRVFEKKVLIKSSASVFLLKNSLLPNEAYFKIKALTNEIPNSYISTIYEDSEQTIASIDDIIDDSYKSINLGIKNKTVTKKFNIESFLSTIDIKIDFLFSPFSLLFYEYLQNQKENSLNIFILNNNIYAFIIDDKNKIEKSIISSLTKFEEIEKSKFYNDEIEEQKLYDEIYFLEFETFLKDFIQNYYNTGDKFLNSINIFYDIKQLDDEKLQNLKDDLLIDIIYNKSEIDDILHNLSFEKVYHSQSLIELEKRKNTTKYIVIFALLSTIIVGYFLYFFIYKPEQKKEKLLKNDKIELKNDINKSKIDNERKKEKKLIQILLPDHKQYNSFIKTQILKIFDTIPDDAYLQKIEIGKNETILVINYKDVNNLQLLKTNLRNLYGEVEVLLNSKNKNSYNSLLSVNKSNLKNKTINIPYKKYNIDIKYVKNIISKIIKSYTIKKIKFKNNKFKSTIYNINFIAQDTKKLFSLFDILQKENKSLYITYPIIIEKIDKNLNFSLNITVNYH